MKGLSPPRSTVSLALAALFTGLSITGVLAYLRPYSLFIAGFHTLLGLTLLLAFGWHLKNNWLPLRTYLRQRRRALLALSLPIVLALGVSAELPPMSTVLETGANLRRSAGLEETALTVINTHLPGTEGQALRLQVRAGPHYESPPQPLFMGLSYTSIPQVAVWVEDLEGRFIATLYVTQKLATAGFLSTDPFSNEILRRPEALPVWAGRRGVRYEDGLSVPLGEDEALDGLTAPTPTGHFDLASVVPSAEGPLRIFLEVNRSYDFNAYWHPERFPEDPVYSGSGSSGQPSLVYAATLAQGGADRYVLLKPVGRGHHSGAHGELITDFEGMDTALELLGPVVAELSADS
ncbi:MAG: hypothetical protein ACO3VD_05545 [Pseudomonadales bacterium]|jgi:hypothetical protein